MRQKIIALTALLSLSSADAQWSDLSGMVASYDTLLPGGDLMYNLRDTKGTSLIVTLDLGNMDKGGVSELQATAYHFRGSLTRAELELFAGQLHQFAVKCFNIDPTRKNEIRDWVLVAKPGERPWGQSVPGPSVVKNFGPLKMTLYRWVNSQSHSVSVSMSREGTPNKGPWVNYCLPSG